MAKWAGLLIWAAQYGAAGEMTDPHPDWLTAALAATSRMAELPDGEEAERCLGQFLALAEQISATSATSLVGVRAQIGLAVHALDLGAFDPAHEGRALRSALLSLDALLAGGTV